MRSDISELRVHALGVDRRIDIIDTGGSRGMALLTQRVLSHEDLQKITEERLSRIVTRLDDFINQVNRLDTPLSRKVEVIASEIAMIREINNGLRDRTITMDANMVALKDTVRRVEERVDKVVQVMDSMYAVLNEHLRVPHIIQPSNPIIPRAPRKRED